MFRLKKLWILIIKSMKYKFLNLNDGLKFVYLCFAPILHFRDYKKNRLFYKIHLHITHNAYY